MKKIKYLLWIWLFGALFSTCFGSFNYDQIYLDSSDNVLSEFRIYFVSSPNATRFYRGKWIYSDYFHLNFAIVNDSKLRDDWNITWYNIFWNFWINNWFNYSIWWSGYGLDWNNTYFSVWNNFTFWQLKNSNYPLILNTSNWNYLSFENENTIAYNWNSYNFQSTWLLKACFYWFWESISCYSSNWFMFNFEFWDSINYNTWVLVIPINDNQYWNFTWNSTLLLAFDNNYRLVYNIVDSYSNNFNVLVNSNIISAWYSTLSSWEFISKSFMDWYGDTPSSFNSRFIPTFYYSWYFVDYAFYWESNWHQGNAYIRSWNLSLVEDLSVWSVFDLIQGGWNQQSTWSMAINTWFLDLCLNYLEFWELNSYLCNKLLNWNNLVLIPGQTWYYLSYWYDENWNLRFWITNQEDLEQQMSWYIWEQDENWNWYTYLPEESNTWVDNSDWLKDYFNNWFENWIFFSCPFHYSDSYYKEFKLFWVSHFVPKLWQSFLYPVYCMGAWFREWKSIDFFSWINLWLESQLLSSPDYNYLYRLFDLILSLLIMFFIIKIYHLLN